MIDDLPEGQTQYDQPDYDYSACDAEFEKQFSYHYPCALSVREGYRAAWRLLHEGHQPAAFVGSRTVDGQREKYIWTMRDLPLHADLYLHPAQDAKDVARLKWLHESHAPDKDGWVYGVMKVKYDDAGQLVDGPYWTLSDHSDIDAAMEKDQ